MGDTSKVTNTCLICGLRTNQLVNIFEGQGNGPDLEMVIFEKYNFRTEHDTEKFLCYSCNNWLINWWSTNKSSHSDNHSQSSSNSPSKSERNRNEQKRYTNKIERGHKAAEDVGRTSSKQAPAHLNCCGSSNVQQLVLKMSPTGHECQNYSENVKFLL